MNVFCTFAQFAGSRHVFDGIEFYLPQLAHMIIHLEVDWADAILERFALVIAQQSLHFALQLNWILQGALQDYQPELEDGSANPTYDSVSYKRCLQLLRNVERCVVYGKPRAQELQKLYETGKISKAELVMLDQADRRFNALQITQDEATDNLLTLDGWLGVQFPYDSMKGTTESKFYQRFCVLEGHVLNCYRPTSGCKSTLKFDRAMSLQQAQVTEGTSNTIRVKTQIYEFRLQLTSAEETKHWARRLMEEAETSALFQNGEREKRLVQDLSPAQRDRYQFYKDERQFVNDVVQVAEDLRFKDRGERKKLAPLLMAKLSIPDRCYLPLCNSSDIWRRVSGCVPSETRVFNTKERCPVVMQFLAKRGETQLDSNLDVADYMHAYLEVSDENAEVMESVAEDGDELDEEKVEEKSETNLELDELKGSKHDSVWLDDEEAEPPTTTNKDGKGNRRVQRLVRDSVALPAMLAKRMKPHRHESRRRISVVDKQTSMQPMVPILEGTRSVEIHQSRVSQGDDSDNGSVGSMSHVSVERSSVLIKDTILLGDLDEGDIGVESINRAKAFVSGGESWAEKTGRMLESARKHSVDSEGVQLEIASCLAKSNDDLRQEVFVMQMIHYYKSVFAQAKLPLWLKTYRILSTSKDTGILELLTDATSIDGLKKSDGFPVEGGLRKYFEIVYGNPNDKAFKAAQNNFMQSLAGYALVSYLLGLKDRHNGNIMIDTRGHLIFIDFGFALGMAPGHEFSMERAPFKLTREYIDVMGGVGSECYKEFQRLFVSGFEECRRNSQIALGLVEIMMFKSNYPCFTGGRYGNGKALTKLEKRLMLRVPDKKVKKKALNLIRRSKQHFGTYLYDVFQHATNGYAL